MIEIKRVKKRNILTLISDEDFWNHEFLAISKHRLYSHFKNPNLEEDDLVLLLSYLDKELVGYLGVFIDKIMLNGKEEKIGWLSTWWVHPKTKGKGIGRELLHAMYTDNKGKIGISQFTPSAKRVYDKSGYFVDLKVNKGVKAVLRSNMSFVMPILFSKTKKMIKVLNMFDDFINIFINGKLSIQRKFITSKNHTINLEYVNIVDHEILSVIHKFNKKDISYKGAAFFEWMKAYHWVIKAPLLNETNKSKYEFSMYDVAFDYFLIKLKEKNRCVGFIVLQRRNTSLKVLFTYYDKTKKVDVVSDIIKLHAIDLGVREIICYDEEISENLNKSKLFLYKRKKVKQSIISKAFGSTNFEEVRMNFGDGDCSFA